MHRPVGALCSEPDPLGAQAAVSHQERNRSQGLHEALGVALLQQPASVLDEFEVSETVAHDLDLIDGRICTDDEKVSGNEVYSLLRAAILGSRERNFYLARQAVYLILKVSSNACRRRIRKEREMKN